MGTHLFESPCTLDLDVSASRCTEESG